MLACPGCDGLNAVDKTAKTLMDVAWLSLHSMSVTSMTLLYCLDVRGVVQSDTSVHFYSFLSFALTSVPVKDFKPQLFRAHNTYYTFRVKIL